MLHSYRSLCTNVCCLLRKQLWTNRIQFPHNLVVAYITKLRPIYRIHIICSFFDFMLQVCVSIICTERLSVACYVYYAVCCISCYSLHFFFYVGEIPHGILVYVQRHITCDLGLQNITQQLKQVPFLRILRCPIIPNTRSCHTYM